MTLLDYDDPPSVADDGPEYDVLGRRLEKLGALDRALVGRLQLAGIGTPSLPLPPAQAAREYDHLYRFAFELPFGLRVEVAATRDALDTCTVAELVTGLQEAVLRAVRPDQPGTIQVVRATGAVAAVPDRASPLRYVIDRSRRRVTIVFHDEPSFAEWATVMDAVLADPAFGPGFGLLLDRRLTRTAPTVDLVNRAADHLGNYADRLQGCRIARLAAAPATYGMGRMAEVREERAGIESAVFYDLAEAEAWLAWERSR